uniref:OmpA-OmpF porin, OOP family protein (TC.OOP) n=1 Tax=uncultured marine group II/III euryarchaeote KM3_57_F04 TaxID=1456465 RepID=A0A075HCN4_9EURY|nr:OmpA-OmpF porin, OOP family protein (TC.OOP) [uncultured marine group II/III euryarchaeote KM3_57_F04]
MRPLLPLLLTAILLLAGCLHAVDPAIDPTPDDGLEDEQEDTDGDGVFDADDICPDTPPATDVDSSGCPVIPETPPDADGDSVPDADDSCPDTVRGAEVDAVGCSAAQLDSDGDGVSDEDDLCPDTQAGEDVDSDGCTLVLPEPDSDGDRIPDADDACPNTPANESVDSSGCAASQRDLDGDGISDADDACPDTPANETVDSSGCAASQRDLDGDGISDADDACPDTPANETVDETGCTVEPEPQGPIQIGVGIHHITEFWSEQAQLNQTGAAFIRINIGGEHFGNYIDSRTQYDWTELDSVVVPNADKVILATVYPSHSGLTSSKSPKYPETAADIADLETWLSTLAQRYGEAIEYWQFSNEVNLHWDWADFDDYTDLYLLFHDTIVAEDPEAKIVPAGISGGSASDSIGYKVRDYLYPELAARAGDQVDAIDLHHHKAWDEGYELAERVRTHRQYLLANHANMSDVEFVVTESSTWMDNPENTNHLPQTEAEQAAYAVTSIYSALAANVTFCVFGTLQDRVTWQNKEELHKFNLNGIFFNESKTYGDGTSGHSGPKEVAFTLALMLALTAGLAPGDVNFVDTGDANLVRIDVAGPNPHSVVWYIGDGTYNASVAAPAGASSVTVLDSTPTNTSVWPVGDPYAAFSSTTANVADGEITLTLTAHMPVFLIPAG